MSIDDRDVRAADTRMARAVYRFFRRLILLFGALWWRLSVEGLERLPDGPFVLSPVHRSYIDTPLMAVIPRRMRFMGKAEVWKYGFLGRLMTMLGGFPVERGTADRDALHLAIDVIENGEPVVLFPEGTRRDGPTLFPLFDGPAYVAGRTQVPIVPVGIGGSARSMPRKARFLRPTKIHIIVGEPLDPPVRKESGRVSRRSVSERTAELSAAVQALYDEAQAKVGTPNEPELDEDGAAQAS
ncbi:MAG: lysophospholipid acyltransferase family protein [Actinomycetota bacterium]